MSGILQMFVAAGAVALQPSVTVITSASAGSVTAPAGYTKVTVEALGGGGNGFGNAVTSNRAGGGGGLFAISNANIAVTGGSTLVYYSVGAAVTQSWVNVGTNAAPSASTTGCLAKNGGSATSGPRVFTPPFQATAVAGLGTTAGSIGATTRNGGDGASGNNSLGGGGAGASTAGSTSTAGTDTTGLSPSTLMGGGTGGLSLTAGTEPSGGGGSHTSLGTNPAGAIGRVRIVFYA